MQALDGTMMRLARTVMAFVIALSVAMPSATGAAAVSAKSAGMADSADMSVAMDDCCPDHAKPCDQGGDQCQSMVSCAYQSFGISNAAVSQFAYPLLPGHPFSTLAEQAVPLHAGNLPFRPPRV